MKNGDIKIWVTKDDYSDAQYVKLIKEMQPGLWAVMPLDAEVGTVAKCASNDQLR